MSFLATCTRDLTASHLTHFSLSHSLTHHRHSFAQSPNRSSLNHSNSLTHSPSYSLTHPLDHSLHHSIINPSIPCPHSTQRLQEEIPKTQHHTTSSPSLSSTLLISQLLSPFSLFFFFFSPSLSLSLFLFPF